jgi:tRNA modification GTPase
VITAGIGDTIFAVGSGPPPAAIAIMRISGPEAFAAVRRMAGQLPTPRMASLRAIRDPQSGALLDLGVVIAFPGPTTATGEDLVELHLHGGRAVVTAVSGALAALPGFRPAEAGEFTRRALASGRIDLAEAEGLGDLLTAQTEGQRRAAMASVEGKISRAVKQWSARVLDLSAQVEAALDFSDEDDVSELPVVAVRRAVEVLVGDLATCLSVPAVERLHQGIRLVLAGPPNSGKSTLLNVLADRDVAIVSPIAGTTRDRIEAAVIRDGIAYVLTDTAGLASATDDPIEAMGIARAREAVVTADIVLWLADEPPPKERPAIWLWPRADVVDRAQAVPVGRIAVSAHSGQGIPALWAAIGTAAAALLPRTDQLAFNERQRRLCADCLEALATIEGQGDLLIVAEQLRQARLALDAITGATNVEAMLDALFGRFCIGK